MLFLIISCVRDSNANGSYSVQLIKADEIRTSNPEQSRILLNNINDTQLTNNEKALYQYLTALNLFINGNLPKAKVLLNSLLQNSQDVHIQSRTLGTLLSIYATSNDWLHALQTVNLLHEYLETELNPKQIEIERTKLSILNFYNNIGEYNLAKQMAVKLLNDNISLRTRCIASTELLHSQINTAVNNLDVKDFENTVELCLTLNDSIISQGINGYLAEYYLTRHKPKKAIEILEANISKVIITQYQALIAGFYDLLAQSHLLLKYHPEAERYAQILLRTEEQHQYHPAITTAYKVLAEVNEHRKYYELAFYYYKKYSEASQIELDQNNAKLLAIQKAKLDLIEKNTQIVLLDKENALLKTQALLDNESAQNRRLALSLLLMALAVFVLWAYKNRKTYLEMRYFAQTDKLTGIANRHHFANLALSAIKLCKKTDQPVSFVIFDLDFFKKINDKYGHVVGDEALKMAADAAKSACRRNDIIGRLGGEEFGILLTGCGNHLAAHIAEKCRRAIEKVDTSATGHQFTLTASFGVSDSSVCGYEFTTLFAGADRALYRSKDLGRNQVFNYQENSFALDI